MKLIWQIVGNLLLQLDMRGMEKHVIRSMSLNWLNHQGLKVRMYMKLILPHCEKWTYHHKFIVRKQ